MESKPRYSVKEMLDLAKRLRSPGYSHRSGRKLKRRSHQPEKERRKVHTVLLAVLLAIMAVVASLVYWLITRDHAAPGETIKAIPTVPGQ